MGGTFEVRAGDDLRGRAEWLVVNTADRSRPVAEFADRADAEAHAERLNAGPLDWDEQEAWQDEWDDDDWGWDDDGEQDG